VDLVARYHLTSIGIFGSFTKKDFREDSDIDILIDYDQPIGIEFIDLAEELEKILDRKVDLVSKNGVKSKYFQSEFPASFTCPDCSNGREMFSCLVKQE
jgi:predicted nucleotidyltransferase